mmetsp:Transcript_12940/g.34671  ORF Transcript_12940/g.34671 Transcript_12940/m.34671 type:complete len:118 (+) Transcript_12940:126-479(+)
MAGSGAGSRNWRSVTLRYNSLLNTLDCALASPETPARTLVSHFRNLHAFAKNLKKEEVAELRRENQDWDLRRRQNLLDRCVADPRRLPGRAIPCSCAPGTGSSRWPPPVRLQWAFFL